MKLMPGSVETRRAARAPISPVAICCVLIIGLVLAGCAATKAAGTTLPSAQSISTGSEDSREQFSLRVPDDWNGRVVMLLRGPVPHQSVHAASSSVESTASALLHSRLAVATPSWGAGGATGIVASGGQLSIHFAVGFGSPTSVYLVGMSQGEYVALATIGKTGDQYDREMVYAPGGFVHVSRLELQDARTIELALQANEPMAALLANRLDVDRMDLAEALEFYYALLTGARNSVAKGGF